MSFGWSEEEERVERGGEDRPLVLLERLEWFVAISDALLSPMELGRGVRVTRGKGTSEEGWVWGGGRE